MESEYAESAADTPATAETDTPDAADADTKTAVIERPQATDTTEPDTTERDTDSDADTTKIVAAGAAGVAAAGAAAAASNKTDTTKTGQTDESAGTDEPESSDTATTVIKRPQVAQTDTKPQPESAPADAPAVSEWSTVAHEPKVIPGTSTKAGEKRNRGRIIAATVAAVVVVVAVVGGIFAFVALREPAPADEAADAANRYISALSSGDLNTLREVTCGREQAFYQSQQPDQFQKIFNAQRDRNELIKFGEIKAVRVDGNTAVVELPVAPGNRPQEQELTTINLQKSGDDWKVCTPQ